MNLAELIINLQKIACKCPSPNVIVRGGGANDDDAWDVKLSVFRNAQRHVTVVIEHEFVDHYNYPRNYRGIDDVTKEFLS